jgi:CheY-like chemotaxis protein
VDRTRIRQVLINLLNNAARFTLTGGATIQAEGDGQSVVVSVADTGVGIPPDELPLIFKEFHRADDSKPGPYGGRGLGLTICRRFVELHGGSMWVESAPDEGSKFSFSLPVSPGVVAAPARDDWETWARVVAPHPDPTVAVVAPDDPAADVFRRYLDGCHVVRVSDLRQAHRLAARTPLRALILATSDSHARLPALDPDLSGLKGVPVVVCPMRTRVNVNPDLRVAKYLVKPVDREQLREALASLPRKPLDVAIVDDDPEMIRLLSRMVRSLSRRYRITTASGGAEALERLQIRRPDVVLLDLLMPGIDGYRVMEQMKADSRLAEVPVVVITARGTEEELVIAGELAISRPEGLSVGEMMGYLRALLAESARSASPGPPGAPAG